MYSQFPIKKFPKCNTDISLELPKQDNIDQFTHLVNNNAKKNSELLKRSFFTDKPII